MNSRVNGPLRFLLYQWSRSAASPIFHAILTTPPAPVSLLIGQLARSYFFYRLEILKIYFLFKVVLIKQVYLEMYEFLLFFYSKSTICRCFSMNQGLTKKDMPLKLSFLYNTLLFVRPYYNKLIYIIELFY